MPKGIRSGLCAVLGAVLGAAATLLPPSVQEPAGAATVASPSASIDATGARDVTAEMQAFLASVPNGSTISFPSNARYRAEGTLTIRNKNDIVVEGNGATFFATQVSNVRAEAQWVIADVSNIEFSDLKIRGTHTGGGQDEEAYVPEREAQHGLLVQGGERILVHDLDIRDVYGDFVYVGRSAIGGRPTNVFVYDNYMRRNGRQGISVTDGTNVLIESNDIADTRRATFDLEPLPGWWVENVWIRENKVGPGRLMFVAGHGAGALNDVHIVDNVLTGKTISIDMLAPNGTRRANVWVTGNRSDQPDGNPREAFMRFVNYDNVEVRNNVQPIQTGRRMSTVAVWNACNVRSENNNLGAGKVGEVLILGARYDCSQQPPPRPSGAPAGFTGDHLVIDVGGLGSDEWGIVGCRTPSDCGGYIASGSVERRFASSLAGYSGYSGVLYQSMFEGDPRFAIPVRSGTYDLTLSFVEPTYSEPLERRFYYDIEGDRAEITMDVVAASGGIHRLLQRTYRVTIGDGVLDIEMKGSSPPILSLITISRA